jgi:hypothetical protein
MNPTENLSRQIKTITTLSQHWLETMPKKPRKKGDGPEWREWEGLSVLLSKFKEFATNYEAVLQDAPVPIQKFTINKGVENLLQGFSVISRACEQRRGKITNDSLGYFLAQAEDALDGYRMQWKGHEYGSPYLELKSPVAYFEKTFGISRSLYAPEIPIVSIPITMYNDPGIWLALAHEIGHHIYWNSLDNYEETDEFQSKLNSHIQSNLSPQPRKMKASGIWQSWAEEVFADICGTLFAGPSYVISCQNTAAEKARKPTDLAVNDGEHPAGYLRPIIALQIIREIGGSVEVIKAIESRWTTYCRGVETEICRATHPDPVENGSSIDITMQEFASDIPAVVRSILKDPLWPGKKSLIDLIRTSNEQLVQVENLGSLVLAEQSEEKVLYGQRPGTKGPNLGKMTESVRRIWKFLRGRLSSKEPSALDEWEKFLDLSLDENHGHWLAGAHDDCRTHLIYALHKHDQGGSGTVVNC